ncbi:hypothetical protein GCM10023083_32580 [Streptomyces phyllanthi]
MTPLPVSTLRDHDATRKQFEVVSCGMIQEAEAHESFSQRGGIMKLTDSPVKKLFGVLSTALLIGSATQFSATEQASAASARSGGIVHERSAGDRPFSPLEDEWP